MIESSRKLSQNLFLSLSVLLFLSVSIITSPAHAQAGAAQTAPSITSDQQKQLNRLNELAEQLQKDRDVVHSAASQHGWDSNETDAAQQRLFQDRQEYRTLRRSLQRAGIAVPPDVAGPGPGTQNPGIQSRHCGNHSHGDHGCCGGDGCCGGKDGCMAHSGNCCCEGHGT